MSDASPLMRAFRRFRPNRWSVGTVVVATLVATPLIAVAALAVVPGDEEIWAHLSSTVLPLYVRTTLLLMVGVGIGVVIVGAGTAWLVTMCRFPGCWFFNWALLLPLAVPTYVLAFVITDQLEYAGALQVWLREAFGWRNRQDYWFPEIRSLGGAISVMTLVLYPYVYL
ncbi:MAG TPA: iron ABC transporter permease, partial [Rhodospirillales bacterium]